MQIIGSNIVVQSHGRELPIARFTQLSYFDALVRFGVKPSYAAAATRNLITVKVKAS